MHAIEKRQQRQSGNGLAKVDFAEINDPDGEMGGEKVWNGSRRLSSLTTGPDIKSAGKPDATS